MRFNNHISYAFILIFVSSSIQARELVPIPRQDGEEDAISAIQNSENSQQTLQNVGNLIAYIFTNIAQIPVAILQSSGVIPTPPPPKIQSTTPTPTAAAVQVKIVQPAAAVTYPQVQQQHVQQVQQPAPQAAAAAQPAPQANVANQEDGGDSGDGEDDNDS